MGARAEEAVGWARAGATAYVATATPPAAVGAAAAVESLTRLCRRWGHWRAGPDKCINPSTSYTPAPLWRKGKGSIGTGCLHCGSDCLCVNESGNVAVSACIVAASVWVSVQSGSVGTVCLHCGSDCLCVNESGSVAVGACIVAASVWVSNQSCSIGTGCLHCGSDLEKKACLTFHGMERLSRSTSAPGGCADVDAASGNNRTYFPWGCDRAPAHWHYTSTSAPAPAQPESELQRKGRPGFLLSQEGASPHTPATHTRARTYAHTTQQPYTNISCASGLPRLQVEMLIESYYLQLDDAYNRLKVCCCAPLLACLPGSCPLSHHISSPPYSLFPLTLGV
eukprot:1141269-Pelagomonas_calceolata.AAC.1